MRSLSNLKTTLFLKKGCSRKERGSNGKAISHTDLTAYFISPQWAWSSSGLSSVAAGVIYEVLRTLDCNWKIYCKLQFPQLTSNPKAWSPIIMVQGLLLLESPPKKMHIKFGSGYFSATPISEKRNRCIAVQKHMLCFESWWCPHQNFLTYLTSKLFGQPASPLVVNGSATFQTTNTKPA